MDAGTDAMLIVTVSPSVGANTTATGDQSNLGLTLHPLLELRRIGFQASCRRWVGILHGEHVDGALNHTKGHRS